MTNFTKRPNVYLAAIAVLSLVFTSRAADFYIAQTAQGAGTGADAADALPVGFFNISGNWNSPTKIAGKIGPGDTVHLCGTITTSLVVQAGGTPGSVITVLFAPGAKMSAPAWSGNIINISQLSYITVDGGATGQIGGYTGNPALANGIIESTDNGTNLDHQANATGVYIQDSQYITVQNLEIRNLYVHVPGPDDGSGAAVYTKWNGGSAPSNITVNNCIFHDMATGFGITYGPASQNFTYSGSTAYNANWGGSAGDDNGTCTMAHLVVSNNYFHDWVNWDQTNDDNHHNGFFAWATYGILNDVTYSGNVLGSNSTTGTNDQTSDLFVSGNSATGSTGTINVYDNLFVDSGVTSSPSNGQVFIWPSPGSTARVYNNTFIGAGGGIAIGINGNMGGTSTYDIKNNIAIDKTFISVEFNAGVILTSNYNNGYELASYTPGAGDEGYSWSSGNSAGFMTFAQWQTLGYDRNSVNSNPNLNGSYVPQPPSAAIGGGANLSSYFTTDAAGNSRPPSPAAWDIGAYEHIPAVPTIPRLEGSNGHRQPAQPH